MLKKVHLRLTLLCTGITGIILICMTFLYLLVAEANLKNNYYYSFENDVKGIVFNLESQSVISYEWLSRLEANEKYLIFLEDNGQFILYGNIKQNRNRQELLSNVKKIYSSSLEKEARNSSSLISYHKEFTYIHKNAFFAFDREEYYVSYGKIPKKQGFLEVYVFCSLKELYRQIYIQKAIFAFINLAALVVLFFFSWHFIKILLRPVGENQKKQAQFISAASHELRTPLTVILSSVSALKKISKGKGENIQKENNIYQIIESELNRMSRLISDMLLLANGDSQTYSIQIKETEADTLLLNCYEAFEALAGKKGLSMSVSLPDTPQPPLKCDPDRISQVLSILIHNAISYSDKGTILLKEEYKEHHHYFSVIDQGIGIPDEEKKNIFERFYRVDASRSKKDHFGLGLCIALEIVKGHDGSIFVFDTPGGGSTFVVKL